MQRACRLVGLFLFACSALGCAAPLGGWDYSSLPGGLGDIPVVRASRLFDAPPHFAPLGDGLVLFLCRWPDGASIPVSLPPDGDPRELEILRTALAAWSSAGIGVSFQEVAPAAASLEIRFVPKSAHSGLGTGNALADCAVETDEAGASIRGGRVEAELRWASIHLIRQDEDALGRKIVLDEDQLLGAALHELGHALGYSAHPAVGGSVMQRTTEGVRKIGAQVRAGGAFADPNLKALYALPAGVIVGRLKPPPGALDLLVRFDARARRIGLEGPYSRVGDVRARYFYRDVRRAPVALKVPHWRRDVGAPAGLVFEPNARADDLLGGVDPARP